MYETNLLDSEKKIIDAITEFNNDIVVQKLESFYFNQSVPEIFGVSRQENSHSTFLAWLFNPAANHGLGNKPLIQLLELYLRAYNEQQKEVLGCSAIPTALKNSILVRSISILSAIVKLEDSAKVSNTNGRSDIVIYCDVRIPDSTIEKLRIIIENKVYSTEHKSQTQRYFDYHNSSKAYNSNGECIEQCLYIYLTPPFNRKGADCKSFVHITYQNLLDHVLERMLMYPTLVERTRFILTEYINSLSILSEHIEARTIKCKTIMAIGKRERELLQSFWDKYSNLFITASTAISTDENSSEEDRKAASDIVEMVQKINNRKDYSRYSINGTGCYVKGVIPAETIRTYINDHPNISYEELVNLFPDKLQGGFGVIRRSQDVKEKHIKRYRHTIEHNGETLLVCSEWGGGAGGNFPKFIQYVNGNKGLNITITKVEE